VSTQSVNKSKKSRSKPVLQVERDCHNFRLWQVISVLAISGRKERRCCLHRLSNHGGTNMITGYASIIPALPVEVKKKPLPLEDR